MWEKHELALTKSIDIDCLRIPACIVLFLGLRADKFGYVSRDFFAERNHRPRLSLFKDFTPNFLSKS